MTQTAIQKTGTKQMAHGATRHLYDVVVVGAQLAGVVAAGALAKRGYRVLHLDLDGLGASYDDKGYALPYAPALFPSLKLMPSAEAALAELGMAVDLHRALEHAGGDLQLLYPRHRLDFEASAEGRRKELAREFGADEAKLSSALTAGAQQSEATDGFFRAPPALPPDGFFDKWRLRQAAGAYPKLKEEPGVGGLDGHALRQAWDALSRLLTYLDDSEAGPLAKTRPVGQLMKGAYRFPGGREGLREALRKKLAELGADAVGGEGEAALVEEIVFEGSKVAGVRLVGNPNLYRAACVIAAVDAGVLGRLIPPKNKKKKLSELVEAVRPRRFLFAVNLVMKTAGLPVGLKDTALLVPGDEELGPVLMELSPAKKAGKELADEKVVTLGAYVSYSERDASEERLRELAKRLEAVAMSVMPFAERSVVSRSVPVLDAKSARGSRLLPHPLLEVGEEQHLGVTGLRQKTPAKNLFLASREVLPGLGTEGEFMAGLRAAHLVQEMLKKHDPLK